MNTLTLLMLPPLDSHAAAWADEIMRKVPEWKVVLVEDDAEVDEEDDFRNGFDLICGSE